MFPYWFAIERIFDSRRYERYHWYHCYDDIYWLYGVHSQHMLGNLAQYCKSRSAVSQSDWHKVGSVVGRSANRRSRNWRSIMHGKKKHSWLTINSEHQVNQRSVNRRSNLIWLAIEEPDLSVLHIDDLLSPQASHQSSSSSHCKSSAGTTARTCVDVDSLAKPTRLQWTTNQAASCTKQYNTTTFRVKKCQQWSQLAWAIDELKLTAVRDQNL